MILYESTNNASHEAELIDALWHDNNFRETGDTNLRQLKEMITAFIKDNDITRFIITSAEATPETWYFMTDDKTIYDVESMYDEFADFAASYDTMADYEYDPDNEEYSSLKYPRWEDVELV